MSLVYVYGSGECEQLGLGDDAPAEIKRPRKPAIFDVPPQFPARSIVKIQCGAMHTLALGSDGSLWTWGCNDDGSLGRDGAENVPMKVESLPIPVDGIAAGDCHSVAYSTSTNQVYIWGCYRLESASGRKSTKMVVPQRFAKDIFKGKCEIKKIASGSNHSIALTKCGKVFGWGSAESGQNGRVLSQRKKDDGSELKPEKINAKNAVDVFCGNMHSFYLNKDHHVYAWGLNNHGQLGIGSKNNTCLPTRIRELDPYEGDYIVQVDGGEHHSIARTKDGAIYCWGNNEEGQLGIGDTYGKYLENKKKKDAEEKEKAEKEAALAAEQQPAENKEEAPVDNGAVKVPEDGEPVADQQIVEKKATPKKTKPKPKKVQKEDDLKYIQYFYRPVLIEKLYKRELTEEEANEESKYRKAIVQVTASGHYSYAVEASGMMVYSWGFGSNMNLGNRKDENEYEPYQLETRMFEENPVAMVSLGTQHVVVLTKESPDAVMPTLQIAAEEAQVKVSPAKINTETQQNEAPSQSQKQDESPAQNQQIIQQTNDITEIQEKVEEPVQNGVENSQHSQVSQSKKRNLQQFQGQQALDQSQFYQQNEPIDAQDDVKRLKVEEPLPENNQNQDEQQ